MPDMPLVPDWGCIIDELLSFGVTREAISSAMGTPVSNHMIRFYRDGAQPVYFRGAGLIALWCASLGKTSESAPMTELRRGYRSQGTYERDTSPKVQSLPQWPPIEKRKPGRPRKVREAA